MLRFVSNNTMVPTITADVAVDLLICDNSMVKESWIRVGTSIVHLNRVTNSVRKNGRVIVLY